MNNDLEEDDATQAIEEETTHAQSATAKKRLEKRHLREKRRSTGVVVMPPEDDEETDDPKKGMDATSTYENQSQDNSSDLNVFNSINTIEEALEHIKLYQDAVNEWQNAYNAVDQELQDTKALNETLVKENQKLKTECDSLMAIVRKITKSK